MNTETAQAIKQSQYEFLLIPGTRGVKGEDMVFEAFAAVQEHDARFKLVLGMLLFLVIIQAARHYRRTKRVSGVFLLFAVLCFIGYQQGYASLINPFPSMDVYQLHPSPHAKATSDVSENEPYVFRTVDEKEEQYDITLADGSVHQIKKTDYWIEKRIDIKTDSVTQLQLCLFDIDSD